jgi:hypothetical protein
MSNLTEFNELLDGLAIESKKKATKLMMNYQLDEESFIETFQVVEYNIKKDLKSNDISKVSVIEGMEKYL